MEALPQDILIEILSYLLSKQIINNELISNKFHFAIRSHLWIYPLFKPNINYLDFVLQNYKIKSFDLSKSYIDDDQVKTLKDCHTLNLSDCRLITNDSIKELKNCYNLNFSRLKIVKMKNSVLNYNITDESIKELKNCRILNLSGCLEITHKSIKELSLCHTLNLSHCNVTDETIKELNNCHTLYLEDCFRVTRKTIEMLERNGCY
jgi:hypothetical protein